LNNNLEFKCTNEDNESIPEEIKESLEELERVYNKGFSSGFYLGTPTNDDFAKVENSSATESKDLGYLKILHKDKKITILYVKNPDYAAPLMYVRYDDKTNFKLASGEVEIKTISTKYSYAYYFYPVDSYSGSDKADFSSMQDDFTNSLKSFGIF